MDSWKGSRRTSRSAATAAARGSPACACARTCSSSAGADRRQLLAHARDPVAFMPEQERQPRDAPRAREPPGGVAGAPPRAARAPQRAPRGRRRGRRRRPAGAAADTRRALTRAPSRIEPGVLEEVPDLGHHDAQGGRPRVREHVRPQRVGELVAAHRAVMLDREIGEDELGTASRKAAVPGCMVLTIDTKSPRSAILAAFTGASIASRSVVAKSRSAQELRSAREAVARRA